MQRKAIFLFLFSILLLIPLYGQENPINFQQKHVLLVYGGWPGHQPDAFGAKMAAWFEQHNAKVTQAQQTTVYADEALMNTVDLIVQHITMSKIAQKEAMGLLKAVGRGVGFAGCHGGIGDSFRENTEYQYMVGGQFVKHPGGQIDHKVHFVAPDDPTVEGLPDFEIKTEQYYMHLDPNVNVLAATQFSGEHDGWIDGAVIPVSWKKYYGNGRVFYTSLGHAPEIFDQPTFWTHFTRGIYWASASKSGPKEKWLEPVYSILPKKNSAAAAQ